MTHEEDSERVERLLQEAAAHVLPHSPALGELDARVSTAVRRRRIGVGVLGLAATAAILVPAVLLPSMGDGGDRRLAAVTGSTSPAGAGGPSATVPSSPPPTQGRSPATATLTDYCQSSATLVFRNYQEPGTYHDRSARAAARPWALPGEGLRQHFYSPATVFVVFRRWGELPRQVLQVEKGAGGFWLVTRSVACLDAMPQDRGCGQIVEFQHTMYANTPLPPGNGVGVGALLGQGRVPSCARERSNQNEVFGPRGPVAPVSVYGYPEEPATYAVTVSIANSSTPSQSVRVYQPR